MTFIDELKKLNACPEAVEWVRENDYNLQQAWENCHRGDWMLWLAFRKKVNDKKLTLAKARCARLVIHLMEDEQSRNAVEVAEKYGAGQATGEELEKARDAAYDAYADADADAAAAAYDAYAAYAAAAHAAYAAYAAADAAAAAKKDIWQKSADICREILTNEIL